MEVVSETDYLTLDGREILVVLRPGGFWAVVAVSKYDGSHLDLATGFPWRIEAFRAIDEHPGLMYCPNEGVE